MKVQVTLRGSKLKDAAAGAFSLSVSLRDTVRAVKERLELVEPAVAALTGARLVDRGKELDNDARLADCGVKEGASLDYVVADSAAEGLAQQLAELLKARGLPLEELSLLYSHRHGATVGQVLKFLGRDEKLSLFLEECKQFVVDGGHVRLASSPLKPSEAEMQHIPQEGQKPGAEGAKVSVAVRLQTPSAGEVVTNVDLTIRAADTVWDLKERVAESEMIPFADKEVRLNGETMEDDLGLMDCGIHGSNGGLELVARATEQGLVAQLAGLLRRREQRASSPDELSLLFCYTYGAPVARALKLLGLKETLRGFLQRREEFVLNKGCVTLAEVEGDRALDAILDAASFLNVHKVDRAVEGTSSTATIHLAGLPPECRDRWMPMLLQSVASGLRERLEGQPFGAVDVEGDAVRVAAESGAVHQLRLAPVAQ